MQQQLHHRRRQQLVLAANGQPDRVIDAVLCERMVKAVGFRNLSVHEYDKINWEIVFDIATKRVNDFKNYARIMDGQK